MSVAFYYFYLCYCVCLFLWLRCCLLFIY